MEKNLRKTEQHVLSQLELDARMPFSTLGKRIRQSQQQVSYTTHALLQKGIIQNFFTVIDYSKLDLLNFRVYFRLNYVDEEKLTKLIDYLRTEAHTSWIATCGGRYDLVCSFLALNPSQFNKTLRGTMEKFPQQLQNYTVLTTIVIRSFGRKYLFRNPSVLTAAIVGGDRKPEEIDGLDMQILSHLSQNARRTAVEMAKQLSVTPKTVIEHMKELRKRRIVIGYKPALDIRKTGYSPRILLIKYHNVSSEFENRLIAYLRTHSQVIGAVKTIGEWDLEITTETKETTEFRAVEREIRSKFAPLIQQIESIPVYQTHKVNYFPAFLL